MANNVLGHSTKHTFMFQIFLKLFLKSHIPETVTIVTCSFSTGGLYSCSTCERPDGLQALCFFQEVFCVCEIVNLPCCICSMSMFALLVESSPP